MIFCEITPMTTYEMLSVVAIAFTGVVALASIIMPLVINYINNKALLKQKRLDFELTSRETLINELTAGYGLWKFNSAHDNEIRAAIYKAMIVFEGKTRAKLTELANNLSSFGSSVTSDKIFYECLDLISKELNKQSS